MQKLGFDNDKYLKEQSKYIFERLENIDKLYLEFGGKLIGDKHAKRVLPGYDEDVKLTLLTKLKDRAEIIICIYAEDIEHHKMRGDYGITYDQEVLRLIDEYQTLNIKVNSVLLTRYKGQKNATVFKKNIENRGIKVYLHEAINGYPTDLEVLFSENGFAKNPYIETTQPLIIVTGPGAGSGKLATCLNQLYHEHQKGIKASYAKFETFPVWNLPLKHPINVAYEAATVDLNDINVLDSYHLDAYNEMAVNYNRDMQMFPVIRRILANTTSPNLIYQSPTDMGVNRIKSGITNEEVVKEAAQQEIIRRYFQIEQDYKVGIVDEEVRSKMHLLMEESGLTAEDRLPVVKAQAYAQSVKERFPQEENPAVIAIQLSDGQMITGRRTELMDAPGAAIMNALKTLAGISDQIDLLAPMVLQTIQNLKANKLQSKHPILTLNELLIALAISAVTNPTAQAAYQALSKLSGAQAHSSIILSQDTKNQLQNLGIDITCDAVFVSRSLKGN
ncbi:DUF1846 domain-containing protein [Facklamia sp. 7083-14-GEN3]|uniref:DUF1846 domain-containing protein n=1 Tax=Facklamia sp. 7083-14-GEN3 TaxID=2973478 RepID=UPI00215C8BF5|nr:DUF1846 domain-containing protein [Facklamia sp. 7083-14-GEN3]MCR8968875.1 DUF1846 domain-containing protein [Facklamia sp. 7083-14-GEN3]